MITQRVATANAPSPIRRAGAGMLTCGANSCTATRAAPTIASRAANQPKKPCHADSLPEAEPSPLNETVTV